MKRHAIVRQQINGDGKLHFYDENDNEIYPAVHPVHPRRWMALAIWISLFTIIVILALIDIRHLHKEDKKRINEIQASRVYSCQTTYINLRNTFIPFFPPAGERTAQQQDNIDRFLKLTNPAKCIKQTAPNRRPRALPNGGK